MIPLVDLKVQHQTVARDIAAGLARVFDSAAFVLGKEVAAFEEAYARFAGVAHCVGVANGTDALELSLRALGVGPGDEVILPANTFIASALAVMRAGATPVLVDCDPLHLLIDPAQVAARIGARTRVVMPVHLFGQMAPVEPIADLIAGTDIAMVEDAAQAHGARRHGRPAGAFGAIAATSFYPAKNLGAYGDAGAVLTRDPALANQVRVLRNYGSDVTYHHPETGFNSRLDAVQAVVLSAKLPHLAAWNEARCRAAARYCELLLDVPGVGLPRVLEGNEHVWHLFVVRVPRRDEVLKRLHEAGIGAGIHYPVPIHLQGALAGLGYARGAFPVAERAATEILSLPLFPEITADQQECVVGALRRAMA